jgi:ligand-binding SRPBCC domain-containing protein
MPTIHLQTIIKSSIQICFDLSRSIDLHKISTSHTKEEAIDGCISGLIGLNEFVTWQAVHFGVKQKLTTKITAFESPYYFCDEQVRGIFKMMKHDHYFKEKDGFIIMNDTFTFESPWGILGKLANKLFLTRYMTELLQKRNQSIKEFAETDQWKSILLQYP